MFAILQRFSIAQELIIPCFTSALFVVCLSLSLFFVFTMIFNIGVYGLVVALTISFVSHPIMLLLFLLMYKSQRDLSLLKFPKNCFHNWRPLFLLIIPSIIQREAWWFIYELGSFFAGILGDFELGAQSILLRYSVFLLLVPSGFSTISLTRIAVHIGKSRQSLISMRSKTKTENGNPNEETINLKEIQNAYKATLIFHLIIGIVMAAGFIFLRYPLARMVSDSPEVVEIAASNTIYIAFIGGLFVLEMANLSALRAIGQFIFPLIVTIICFYGIALPLSIYLTFYTFYDSMDIILLWPLQV